MATRYDGRASLRPRSTARAWTRPRQLVSTGTLSAGRVGRAVAVGTAVVVHTEESPDSTEQGGGQHPPGVTRGKVPQRTDRPGASRGKGETAV